jgi:L-aminopeptidase/D-esterase-like protein
VRNLLTDVPGILVGNAHDARVATGVTVAVGTVAADCLARAIARGVYEATALPYKTAVPDWKMRFGGGRR